MTEFRIVTDDWLGYEVQSRRWWWPFWVQGRSNTHVSVEAAERYAVSRVARRKPFRRRFVKYLGKLATPSETSGPEEKTP